MAQHYVHTVLTTNFDQLVLEGMIRADIIPVVADGIEALTRVRGQPTYAQVVHLHGSMHTYNPRNSGADVRETDKNPAMQRAIYELLHANTLLVVVGYRGNEEGVMSLLISAAKDLRDKVIYWIAHDPSPDALSPQAKQLLGLGRHKYLILGQDADQFFADVMRGLNLGIPSAMRDPVTPLVKVAARIVASADKDISAEIARYYRRLYSLNTCWEKEDQQERLKGELRQLRLSGRYGEAWERLRNMPDASDPELWEMRADNAYEYGLISGNFQALEDSVVSWRRLLELWDNESDSELWASIQNNLGNALQMLGKQAGNGERLDEALKAYRAALSVRTRERHPVDWAMTQNNLGNTLIAVGEQVDSAVKIKQAETAFREALEVYTREQFPERWAGTQSNLGAALRALGAKEGRTELMKQAVAAIRSALEVFTREQFPVQWARTQNSLGNALGTLCDHAYSTEQMNESVEACRLASEVLTREQFPVDWAMTQSNLCNALSVLGDHADSEVQMMEAVTGGRAALEIFTREQFPMDWARTQTNLGSAIRTLGEYLVNVDLVNEAVAIYRAALEVFEKINALVYAAAVQYKIQITLDRLKLMQRKGTEDNEM